MAHTTNKITAPVTIADIQAVIGNSSIYLGTLCAAGTVNKWAKYKPVKLAKVDTCDELDINDKWLSSATWFAGDASGERYGMRFPMLNSSNQPYSSTGSITQTTSSGKTYRNPTSGFFYDLMRNTLRWERRVPVGGSSSPYRILDFNEYVHDAICPLPYTKTKTQYVVPTDIAPTTYIVDCDLYDIGSYIAGGLTLGDIAPPSAYGMSLSDLGECYVGVLFYNSAKDDCFWQCSSYKLKSLTGDDPVAKAKCLHVAITNSDLKNQYDKSRSWKTRAFLCTKSLGYCETFSSYVGPYYLIACDEDETTVTLTQSGTVLVDTMTASRVNSNIVVNVVVSNNTGASVTLSSPKIQLFTPSVAGDDHTFSNTTIANGQSATFSYTFTMQLDTISTATFTATYSGTTVTKTVNVLNK